MIHIRVRDTEGGCRSDLQPEDLHGLIEAPGNLIWLDLESLFRLL